MASRDSILVRSRFATVPGSRLQHLTDSGTALSAEPMHGSRWPCKEQHSTALSCETYPWLRAPADWRGQSVHAQDGKLGISQQRPKRKQPQHSAATLQEAVGRRVIVTRAHYPDMFTRVRFRVRHHVPQPFLCVQCPSVSSQDGTKHNQTFTQHRIPSSSCQRPHLLAHTPTCTAFSAPPQAPSSPVAQPVASEPAPSTQRPRCRVCRRDMHVELYGSGHHARERWCESEVKRRRRWGAHRRVRACVRAYCACMP
jgi:hypothetical protein